MDFSHKFAQPLCPSQANEFWGCPHPGKAERNVHVCRIKQTNDAIGGGHDVCLFGRIDGAAWSGSAGRLLLTQPKGGRQWVRLRPSYPIPQSKTC
jgi:hypothetical protein